MSFGFTRPSGELYSRSSGGGEARSICSVSLFSATVLAEESARARTPRAQSAATWSSCSERRGLTTTTSLDVISGMAW